MSTTRRWLGKTEVQAATACPKCGAAKTFPCEGRRGPRVQNHRERVEAANRLLGFQETPWH